MFFGSPLEQFDLLPIKSYIYYGRWFTLDLSIFNVILILFFIYFLVRFLRRVLYYRYRRKARIVPRLWQYVIEVFYNTVYTIIKQQVGHRGYVYLPFFFTLFTVILLSNLFSLMPFSFALTSQIINIFFMSFTLVFGLFITGLARFGLSFLKLFVPESPLPLLFILIPIEIFSYFIRAFSLAIRLSANIMAGHTLVFIVSSFVLKLTLSFVFLLSTVLFMIFSLELGVAFLQAYVFTVLFAIYLRDSLWPVSH